MVLGLLWLSFICTKAHERWKHPRINFLSLARMIFHTVPYVGACPQQQSAQVSANGKSQLRSCVERWTSQMQVYKISPRYPCRKPRGTTKKPQNNERPNEGKTALRDGFGAGSSLPPPGRPEWTSHNWRRRQDVVVLVCINSRGMNVFMFCVVVGRNYSVFIHSSPAGEKHTIYEVPGICQDTAVYCRVRVFRVLFPRPAGELLQLPRMRLLPYERA